MGQEFVAFFDFGAMDEFEAKALCRGLEFVDAAVREVHRLDVRTEIIDNLNLMTLLHLDAISEMVDRVVADHRSLCVSVEHEAYRLVDYIFGGWLIDDGGTVDDELAEGNAHDG